jgi:hypothetical protein
LTACRSYAVVPDAEGRRVLLLRRGDGWEIPCWETSDPAWWNVVGDLNAAVGRLLQLEVTTLRCLRNERRDDDLIVRFFELEPRGPKPAPATGEWVARERLEIELAEPEHRAVLVRCLDERRDDGGRLGIRWARPRWFAEAEAWIGEQLRGLEVEVDAVVQERTWSISTVLLVETGRGPFYFKAVPLVFASEPTLTRELGRRHPGLVPRVVAVDEDRGWLLMEAFEGITLDEKGDLDTLAAALQRYARLQVEWADRPRDLLALGCADRRLEELEREIDHALADEAALVPDGPERLSPEQLHAVPALQGRLRAACAELRAHGLPPTLEHGDLHGSNIVETANGFLFYDWSDACLSVPFFSLVPLFEFGDLSELPHDRGVLRSAYLEPWGKLVPSERLVEAFELSLFVGLFHQAISYYRIVELTEPRARWEWQRAFPNLVKQLLERASHP